MTKKSIIQHFSDHGIIRTMNRHTLLVLLNSFAEVFEAKEVRIPAVGAEGEIPYEEIKKVVMELHTDNAIADRLGDVLETIAQIKENYDKDRNAFDRIYNDFRFSINMVLPHPQNDLDKAVGISLVDDARSAAQAPLGRLMMFDTKSFKEYPWKYTKGTSAADSEDDEEEGEEEEETEGDKAEEEEHVFSVVQDEATLTAALGELEKKIDKGFSEKQYHSSCHITMYNSHDDKQTWFIIEHGGPHVTVETLEPESKSMGRMSYTPLIRNIVVVDAHYRMMRVKANSEWQRTLYVSLFSEMMTGQDDTFEEKPVYCFDPIRMEGMKCAFGRGEFGSFITSVEVKKLVMTDSSVTTQKVKVTLDSDCDLCDQWEERYAATHNLSVIGLALKMRKDEHSSKKDTVTVRLPLNGGLTVNKAAYTHIVREWLRSNGFERGYKAPELPSCDDPIFEQDKLFWTFVCMLVVEGKMSRNQLYGKWGKRVPKFMSQYLERENQPSYADEWFEPNGWFWDVCKIGDSYYRYHKNAEEPTTEHGIIDEQELEMLCINKLRLVQDIELAINKGKPHRGPATADSPAGLFDLGEHFPTGTHRVVYFKGCPMDKGLSTSLSAFRKDLLSPNKLVCLSASPNKPVTLSAEDAARIQFVPLKDILECSADGKLSLKEGADGVIKDFEFPKEEKPYTRWPGDFPVSPSFHHIDIIMKKTGCWIKFGEEAHEFLYSELDMFTKTVQGSQENTALVSGLMRLIKLNTENPKGWKQPKDTSMLNRLSLRLSQFFGIQELFYESVPETAGKKRYCLYRLAFGRAEIEV